MNQLDANQIADYLAFYPDFLVQHPQLLDTLNLYHNQSGAISLQSHQQKRLQQQLAQLQSAVARIDGDVSPVDGAPGGLANRFDQLRDRLDQLSPKIDRIDGTVNELVRVVAPPSTD